MGLSDLWTSLHDIFGGNDQVLFYVCLAIWPFLLFWTLTSLFMVADLYSWPRWMLSYKVQPDQNVPLDRGKLRRAVWVAILNLTVVAWPVAYLEYPLAKWMGCSSRPEDFPTFWRVIRDLAGCAVFEAFGFYYSHRLAHWGPLYRAIHKKHHEWTAPVAVVAVYAHPVEHIMCNLLPFTLGYIFMSAHLFTAMIWHTIALSSTIVTHSGYHLPLLPSPEFHDFHHLKFNTNYGVFGILDRLHGTDRVFRNTIQARRHRRLYGLTPVRITYPTAKK